MLAMIRKEFRQVGRDRRTLAMLIVMPIVMLVIFGYAASFNVEEIPTVVFGDQGDVIAERLPEIFVVEYVEPGDDAAAEEALVAGDGQVAIVASAGAVTAYVDGSSLFTAQAAVQVLTRVQSSVPALEYEVLFNPELDTSAVLVPGLAGLIIAFIGTIITSLSVVREREAGTFEQLAILPFRPADVFIGKIAPYFIVALADTAIVLTVGTILFDVPFVGSLWPLGVAALLFIFVALGIGILISSASASQGESIQLALMTLLPQIMLSGIIFPLSSMAAGIRWIGYVLPLTYFNIVANGVMLRGAGFADLWRPMVFLAVMAVVVFGLAVIRFTSQLSPARSKVDA